MNADKRAEIFKRLAAAISQPTTELAYSSTFELLIAVILSAQATDKGVCLELIVELQRDFGTAVILITHDLGVVAETAHRVIVMYAGRKVEEAAAVELFHRPLHPYMIGLLGSIPRVGLTKRATAGEHVALQEIAGIVPALNELPAGCAFAPRCPRADDKCRAHIPLFEEKLPDHFAACWHTEERA